MKKDCIDLTNVHALLGYTCICEKYLYGIPLQAQEKLKELQKILIETVVSYLKGEVEDIAKVDMLKNVLRSFPPVCFKEKGLHILKFFSEKEKLASDDVIFIFIDMLPYIDSIPENEEEQAINYLERFIYKSQKVFNGAGIEGIKKLKRKYKNLKIPKALNK